MDNNTFTEEYAKYKNIAYKATVKFRKMLSPCELKSAKYIGVWKALENFSPDRGMALSSYIFLRVKWECLRMLKEYNKDDLFIPSGDMINIKTPENTKAIVAELLETLSDSERTLIDEYFFQNKNTVQLGKQYGITAEGVRLRIQKILSKLRE